MISGEKECSVYSCGTPGRCQGVLVDGKVARNEQFCLRLCQQEERCHWYSFLAEDSLCLLLEDCPHLDTSCSSCTSGQQECQATDSNNMSLMSGKKDFEVINLTNSSMPPAELPEYPFPIEYPAEIFYDERAGVVRACGGEIPTIYSSSSSESTNKCYSFDGISWEPMAPMLEPSWSDSSSRFSVDVPNIGWWVLRDDCGGGCNHIYSNIYTINQTWVEGPSLPDKSMYGYNDTPYDFCGTQVNETHTIVTGGKIKQMGTSITDVWFYNWVDKEWVVGPNMTTARRDHRCVAIQGGGVVVAGGTGLFAEDLSSVEVYDQGMDGGAGGWYAVADLPEDDAYGDHALLFNKEVIWVNGRTIWRLDEAEGWQQLDTSLKTTVSPARAILVPDSFIPTIN